MANPNPTPARLRVLALGATSAIAEATLRLWAEQGASFVLVARSEAQVSAVRDDLLTRGASAATAVVMDLNETDSHVDMLTESESTLGGFDVALLAHGILGDQLQAERDFTAAQSILQTNFLSAVSLLTWLGNYFEERKHGAIAVISSVAGDRGRKSNYVYGASKGGLTVFLQGLRNRVDRAGVNVLTIKPGFVATPMTAHLPPNALFAQPSQVAVRIVSAVATRRDVVYVPGFWRAIMLAVRLIPEAAFKKLNL